MTSVSPTSSVEGRTRSASSRILRNYRSTALRWRSLSARFSEANRSFLAGAGTREQSQLSVAAGQTLQGIPDIGLLLIVTRDGRPVYVRDVANVVVGAKPLEHQAWQFRGRADGTLERVPAVTIAIAKRAGANAVVISERILHRLAELEGQAHAGRRRGRRHPQLRRDRQRQGQRAAVPPWSCDAIDRAARRRRDRLARRRASWRSSFRSRSC